jgi:hypothetical protein
MYATYQAAECKQVNSLHFFSLLLLLLFFLFRELVNGIDVNAMASSGMDGLFYALDRLTRQVSGAV